jgi:hypothetical protein
MDDYSALAQRIAVSVREVRGCLVLSRDGLVLGTYPDDDETVAKPAWLRFCALGEPDKSFVEYPNQTWVFVKRGPYSAFAVAEAGVRPGLLIDQLEQALLTAEDGRTKREAFRVPDVASAPSGKPRASLHPPAGKPDPVQVVATGDQRTRSAETPRIAGSDSAPSKREGKAAGNADTPTEGRDGDVAEDDATARVPDPAPVTEQPVTSLKREPQKLAGGGEGSDDESEDESEVDRVLLAKEFSGLLQVHNDDDEGSS